VFQIMRNPRSQIFAFVDGTSADQYLDGQGVTLCLVADENRQAIFEHHKTIPGARGDGPVNHFPCCRREDEWRSDPFQG